MTVKKWTKDNQINQTYSTLTVLPKQTDENYLLFISFLFVRVRSSETQDWPTWEQLDELSSSKRGDAYELHISPQKMSPR
jgi:hypothetical protein